MVASEGGTKNDVIGLRCGVQDGSMATVHGFEHEDLGLGFGALVRHSGQSTLHPEAYSKARNSTKINPLLPKTCMMNFHNSYCALVEMFVFELTEFWCQWHLER